MGDEAQVLKIGDVMPFIVSGCVDVLYTWSLRYHAERCDSVQHSSSDCGGIINIDGALSLDKSDNR
jgi:hypothetical protein